MRFERSGVSSRLTMDLCAELSWGQPRKICGSHYLRALALYVGHVRGQTIPNVFLANACNSPSDSLKSKACKMSTVLNFTGALRRTSSTT